MMILDLGDPRFAPGGAFFPCLCGDPPWFGVPAKPRRPRKPSIRKTIAAAERGGKTVTSITTPDGVTLHFGKGEATEASNPWLDDLNKATKQ
jgi:hypothetical protein